MVGEYGQCGELAYLKCPLPLDPGVLLTGILSEECSVFKSALAPLRLTFRTAGVWTVSPCCPHVSWWTEQTSVVAFTNVAMVDLQGALQVLSSLKISLNPDNV